MHDPNNNAQITTASGEWLIVVVANIFGYVSGNINTMLQTLFLLVSIYLAVLGIIDRRRKLKLGPWQLFTQNLGDDEK